MELVAYQLKGVSMIWFDQIKKSIVKGAPIVSWDVFEDVSMGHFFLPELRKTKVREFLTLKQEPMSVHEYNLKFTQLFHHAPEMVADMRSMMSLFVSRLSRMSRKKGNVAMLIRGMDIARLMIHVQQVKEDKLKDRGEFRKKKGSK